MPFTFVYIFILLNFFTKSLLNIHVFIHETRIIQDLYKLVRPQKKHLCYPSNYDAVIKTTFNLFISIVTYRYLLLYYLIYSLMNKLVVNIIMVLQCFL